MVASSASYFRGRLIAVIPFVAKILECCAQSRVFRLPNPWLAVMLGMLSEIYSLPDLKLTLKLEVEVLFNNLGIKMRDVKPTQLLAGRKVREEMNAPARAAAACAARAASPSRPASRCPRRASTPFSTA